MTTIDATIVTLSNLTRPALSADELAALPSTGLALRRAGRPVGLCPPVGIIRQRLDGWDWHPDIEHARTAADAAGERCFLVGDGVNEERHARSVGKRDVNVLLLATRRLHALGYSHRLGIGGVLHVGPDETAVERYRGLAAALTKRCYWRDAAAMRALADDVEAFHARDFDGSAVREQRAIELLGGAP